MADYNYEELKHKTVAELRQIAKDLDHKATKDYTQLNKEDLMQAVCKALGVDTLEHPQEMMSGFDKANAKAKIRALKSERQTALEAHDYAKLKSVRRHLHRLNHRIRIHVR